MNERNRKALAALMALLLALPLAAGLIGAGHACAGEDCGVCRAILKSAAGAVALPITELCMAAGGWVRLGGESGKREALCATPVGEHVRLND